MNSRVEVLTSSRGYKIGINSTDTNHITGWIEISFGRAPIKKHFRAICAESDSQITGFCTFVHWSPYFNGITSAISGLYVKGQVLLKWVMITSSSHDLNTVIGSGTDNLVRSPLTNSQSSFTEDEVPHPFHLGMLNLSSDLVKIEALHT